MTDDRTKTGPQDAARVNVSEDYERAYWTKRFGVTRDELKQAVKKVGVSVSAVEKYFKQGSAHS